MYIYTGQTEYSTKHCGHMDSQKAECLYQLISDVTKLVKINKITAHISTV